MAHELFIDRHGVDAWLRWAETADAGIGASESFGSVFEQEKDDSMERAEKNARLHHNTGRELPRTTAELLNP